MMAEVILINKYHFDVFREVPLTNCNIALIDSPGTPSSAHLANNSLCGSMGYRAYWNIYSGIHDLFPR